MWSTAQEIRVITLWSHEAQLLTLSGHWEEEQRHQTLIFTHQVFHFYRSRGWPQQFYSWEQTGWSAILRKRECFSLNHMWWDLGFTSLSAYQQYLSKHVTCNYNQGKKAFGHPNLSSFSALFTLFKRCGLLSGNKKWFGSTPCACHIDPKYWHFCGSPFPVFI